MSGTLAFIVIAIAWAVIGSLKAAAGNAGRPTRSHPFQAKIEPKSRSLSTEPIKRLDHHDAPSAVQTTYRKAIIADMDTESLDMPKVEKALTPLVKKEPILKEAPKKGNQQLKLAPLLKGDRLLETIIVAECLDRPRAYRPHPLNNRQRRG